jgi:hypothetical protein
VFRGQYLPLSLSKRGVPYIKKTKRKKKKEKGKCKTKKRATQNKQKKSDVWLSYFTKPANLSDFTTAETGPIWLVRFV